MERSMVCARSAFAAAIAVAVSGCSGGPSEAQAHEAMAKRAQQVSAGLIRPDYKEQIGKAKLGSCDKADAGGYFCELSMPAGNQAKIRFVKEGGGWFVADDR